jgi:orotidine-5'-phosphate decarboxylase
MGCRLFCAIDANSFDGAASLVRRLDGVDVGIKLGLEFFVAEGPQGVDKIRALLRQGTEVFLDLKLHDIPNTVAGAVRAAAKCRPDFITVHTSGGSAMMQAAAEAAAQGGTKLLGVTVLTHLDAADLSAVGQGEAVAAQVGRLAKLAAAAGLSGVVCSPQEIALLRGSLPPAMQLVVPGIRPAGADKGDQKRTMTPPEAAALGADYLVIGRPITQAADPARAAAEILESMRPRAA